ncbi:hypothetical protein PVK06_004902 [Gossypium arboreum]|uniref:Uncharacterized protein n=1 Tax=Gossypium arboreum TaxID=29729 RepID=A0ABR0QT82_GOSAR|nr:hypothetical protein PVK06_004902 [Gossypium arboreum]
MREMMAVSRWHREEPKDIIKSDMDLEDGRRRNQMLFYGVKYINRARGKCVVRELRRRFHRFNQVNEIGSQRIEGETIHNMIMESNEVLEEKPIGLVERKKRQRVQKIKGREDILW